VFILGMPARVPREMAGKWYLYGFGRVKPLQIHNFPTCQTITNHGLGGTLPDVF